MARKIKSTDYWDKEHFDMKAWGAHLKMKLLAWAVVLGLIAFIGIVIYILN